VRGLGLTVTTFGCERAQLKRCSQRKLYFARVCLLCRHAVTRASRRRRACLLQLPGYVPHCPISAAAQVIVLLFISNPKCSRLLLVHLCGALGKSGGARVPSRHDESWRGGWIPVYCALFGHGGGKMAAVRCRV